MKITETAIEGYNAVDGAEPPYLTSSPLDSGWRIGRWMRQTGRSIPWDCRTSRGDTFHINNMKVRLDYIQGCVEIERIA
jgi:hypothetical protein